MATWSETLQGSFQTITNAGADLLKAKAQEEAIKNNAPVTPAESAMSKYQPLVFGLVGVLVVVVGVMLFKKR